MIIPLEISRHKIGGKMAPLQFVGVRPHQANFKGDLLSYNYMTWKMAMLFARWCTCKAGVLCSSISRQQETWKMLTAEGKWQLPVEAVECKMLIRQHIFSANVNVPTKPTMCKSWAGIHHTSCSLLHLIKWIAVAWVPTAEWTTWPW